MVALLLETCQVIVLSDRARIVVGRATDKADVRFDGTPTAPHMVSRAHAAITCQRTGPAGDQFDVDITDLNSVNGILVDGVRVDTAKLAPGALVTFGSAKGMPLGACTRGAIARAGARRLNVPNLYRTDTAEGLGVGAVR